MRITEQIILFLIAISLFFYGVFVYKPYEGWLYSFNGVDEYANGDQVVTLTDFKYFVVDNAEQRKVEIFYIKKTPSEEKIFEADPEYCIDGRKQCGTENYIFPPQFFPKDHFQYIRLFPTPRKMIYEGVENVAGLNTDYYTSTVILEDDGNFTTTEVEMWVERISGHPVKRSITGEELTPEGEMVKTFRSITSDESIAYHSGEARKERTLSILFFLISPLFALMSFIWIIVALVFKRKR